MSTDVKLNPGEMVIKSSNEIGYGGGLSRQNNELILTNQSLILVHKNLFGKTKEVLRFELSDIVISNQQAQVRLGKKDNVTHTLDVYFQSGVQSFAFTWEDEIKEWANSINTLLTGGPALYKVGDDLADLEHFADTVSGAVRKVREAFGIKSKVQVSCKCPRCGASLTGIQGETIQCPYCDSYVTL